MNDVSTKVDSATRPRPLPTLGYAFMVMFMFGISGAKMLASGQNQLFWLFHVRIYIEYLVYLGVGALLLTGVYLGLSRVTSDRYWQLFRYLCIGWICANIVMIAAFKVSNQLFGPRSLLDALPYPDVAVLLLGLPFALLPRFSELAAKVLRAVAKVIAPLPVILLFYFASVPQYQIVIEEPPAAPAAPAEPAPVLLIVMDSLDRARTTDDIEVLRRFKNLNALAESGTVFSDSRTPGTRTHLSMPAILYQNREVQLVAPNEHALVSNGEALPIDDLPTWFDLVGRADDVRVLIGFHIDFKKIVGDRVDWLQSPSDRYATMSEGFLPNLRSHAYIFGLPTRVPLLSDSDFVQQFYDDRWASITDSTHSSCMTALRKYAPSMVAVFHMVLPHRPWIFDANGRRPVPDLPEDELYRQNLDYADKQLGQMFEELRTKGLWDASTIIVTGDHGYPWAVEGRPPPLKS